MHYKSHLLGVIFYYISEAFLILNCISLEFLLSLRTVGPFVYNECGCTSLCVSKRVLKHKDSPEKNSKKTFATKDPMLYYLSRNNKAK